MKRTYYVTKVEGQHVIVLDGATEVPIKIIHDITVYMYDRYTKNLKGYVTKNNDYRGEEIYSVEGVVENIWLAKPSIR